MAAPGTGTHERASEPPKINDLETFQSMDWFMKKERIFLLAQFWQQVSDIVPPLVQKKWDTFFSDQCTSKQASLCKLSMKNRYFN